MLKQTLMVKIKFAAIALLLIGTSIYTSKALGEAQSNPRKLVDDVWQIVNQNYVDGSFNHQDWQAIRQQYVGRKYTSTQQAYTEIRTMVAKLGDRYTSFFDPNEYQALNSNLSGNFTGVGMQLAENEKTKALTVIAPIEGTPAFKAGILPNDVIVLIDNQSTQGMKIEDAVKRIVGCSGN